MHMTISSFDCNRATWLSESVLLLHNYLAQMLGLADLLFSLVDLKGSLDVGSQPIQYC